MIPYLCNASLEDMKEDYKKLPIEKQSFLDGMAEIVGELDNLEEELKLEAKMCDSIVEQMQNEIKTEYLEEVREHLENKLMTFFASFVDYYYAEKEE